jgi:hypothetical protein
MIGKSGISELEAIVIVNSAEDDGSQCGFSAATTGYDG